MTQGARYRLLAVLYGSQFVPLAFFLQGLTAILRERGVALQQIGLIQLIALVWVVKFAWAPLVDRYGSRRLGHYRGWLLATQVLMVASVLVLIPLEVDEDLQVVIVLIAVVAVLSATQDIAADATAVRLLNPGERGVGNGIQKAGGYFGLMAGGGGALVVYDRYGWAAALGMLAVLTSLPLPFLLRYPERGTVRDERRSPVSFRTLAGFFSQPGVPRWIFVVLPLYYLGIATAYPLVTPMLVDAGWPLDRIGAVSIAGGGSVAMLAALAAGAALSALGRRRALVGFALAQVAAIGALFLLTRPAGTLTGLLAVALLGAAFSAAGTAVYTISMDWSRPTSAGTDYTVQDSFAHLCSQVAGAAGLTAAGAFGYVPVLAVALAFGIAGVVAAARLFRERPVSSGPAHSRVPAQVPAMEHA